MYKSNHKKSLVGFSLFEVLITLLIFSILVSAVMHKGGNSIKNTERIKNKVFAAQIADNYITNLQIRKQWSGAAVHPQVQNYAGREWVVKEVFEQTTNPNFRKVTIEIFEGNKLPDNQKHSIYTLETYMSRVKSK